MANRPRSRLIGLLLPISAIALWQLLESAGLVRYEYLPAPLEVMKSAAELGRSGELAGDVAHTLAVTLAATAIALTFGALLGLGIGLAPILQNYLVASIDFLRTIPAVTLVPVAVMTFGPSTATELMLAVYAALWPVVLCTAAGVTAVHQRQYDIARALRMSPVTTIRKIVIPAVVPAWLIGARLSAVIALLVSIVAEMIMYPRGLGGGLVESLNALAPARMWVYALTCGVIGFALNASLGRAVVLVLPGSPVNADNEVAVSVQNAITQPASRLRGLLPVAAGLVIWQTLGTSDSLFFPQPTEWFTAIRRLSDSGVLMPAVTQTLSTYVLGLALAILIGGFGGVAIGASHRIDRALIPSVSFLAAIPGAAVVPVAALLLGPNQLSGVVVVALIVSWPILLASAMAMRTVPAVRIEMSRTLGLTPLRRWGKVILPSVTPGVMLGVRVASATALIVTLLVDIFGTGAGLGRLLVESQQRFESATAWGLLLMIGAFGYLTSAFFAAISRGRRAVDRAAVMNRPKFPALSLERLLRRPGSVASPTSPDQAHR
jgi:sulfonate transport system permease protein